MNRSGRQYRFLPLLMATLLLWSCEGNTTYEAAVSNETEYDIRVVAVPEYGDSLVEVLPPSGEVTVYIRDQRGGSSFRINPSVYLKDLIITNTYNDTMAKDFRDPDNWEARIRERKKVPSDYHQQYTLTVSEEDF